jgi:hypothetical protein
VVDDRTGELVADEPSAFDEVQASTGSAIEMMRDLAEGKPATSSDEEDLSWIPQNFRRGSLKETTEVMLESYLNAQRKITEEVATRRNLEQALQAVYDDLVVQAMQSEEPEQFYDEEPQYANLAQPDPNVIAAIAAQAAAQFQQFVQAEPVEGQVTPELMRTMKLQAQSAVGAGGRSLGVSDVEQRWHEISSADTGRLGI